LAVVLSEEESGILSTKHMNTQSLTFVEARSVAALLLAFLVQAGGVAQSFGMIGSLENVR
jgi:hypothetical protein